MIKKIILPVFLAVLAVAAGQVQGTAATVEELDRKIKEEERQMAILERHAKKQEELIRASKRMENAYLMELSRYDQRRKAAEQSITILDLRRRKILEEISQMEKEMASIEKDIENIKGFLEERLVAIYKFGGAAELNLLLSSQNVSDALNTGHLLRKLADQDEKLIGSAERESMRIQELTEGLSLRERDLNAKKHDMESQRSTLEKALGKRKVLLKKLRENQDAYRQSLKEAEEDQREIQSKIQAYIKAKEKLSKSPSGTQQTKHPPLPAHKGKFQWPIRGRITSNFGTRVHPVFKTRTVHTGIDIASPNGTPVKAAATGDVLYAGWLRGYGQIVIMDHGGGYSTVYAHLSRISVTEGQRVPLGAVIGNVGDTGVTTGSHLHFEVRINGNAKDPLKYL